MTHTASDRPSRAGERSARPGTPRIAVDLLGGDAAPAVVVDGALQALASDPTVELVLVGPEPVADAMVAALIPAQAARVTVHPAARGVDMAESPARGGDPQTSIAAAMRLMTTGAADAVVSAGPSGVIVAAAVLAVGRLPGARRPALAAVLPGRAGPLVLLDVGAGMQVSPAELVQHAILGAGYAQLAVGIAAPRVGLLSVGSEPGKGDRLRRAADSALRVHPLPAAASYVGPVEGNDVVSGGRCDVVVTDGFTGNVLLKGIEAAFAGVAGPAASVPRAAALLGVAGTVVVCHGAADGADIASGLALAARLVRTDVLRQLASRPAALAEVVT